MLQGLSRRLLLLAASPRAAWWLAAAAFAEASVFPLPPDLLLAPMVLSRPRRAWALAGLCTLASVAGAGLGYAIGALAYDHLAEPLLQGYGYLPAMRAFQARYAEWGVWVILVKGLTPIPFKIVTIASGAAHFPLGAFFLACAVTRGARFFLVAGLLRLFGERGRDWVERRLGWIALAGLAAVGVGVLALRWA